MTFSSYVLLETVSEREDHRLPALALILIIHSYSVSSGFASTWLPCSTLSARANTKDITSTTPFWQKASLFLSEFNIRRSCLPALSAPSSTSSTPWLALQSRFSRRGKAGSKTLDNCQERWKITFMPPLYESACMQRSSCTGTIMFLTSKPVFTVSRKISLYAKVMLHSSRESPVSFHFEKWKGI